MTIADVLASVDRDSRDALVLAVEDALLGHSEAEVFLVCTYFTALAIARMPCGDTADLIADMPRIITGVIANEQHDVVRH